jgi:hypothetical protein
VIPIFDPSRPTGVPVGIEPVAGRDDARQLDRRERIVGRQVWREQFPHSIVGGTKVTIRGNRPGQVIPMVRADRALIQTSNSVLTG